MPNLFQDAISLPRGEPLPRTIKILHPDYPAAENTLLLLRAFDDNGIDYDTALVACGIIAGNIWTGFFATRRVGTQAPSLERVCRPEDGILRGAEYFFQLPDDAVSERPYPVVVRFDDWIFPHGDLPSPWNEVRRQVLDGTSCRVTDSMWGVERAHLIPLTVQDWWNREVLQQYTATDRFSQNPIDASDNIMFLRSDIHTVFDDKVFAIVPKRDQTAGQANRGELSLVTHMVNPISDNYFNRHYHNRRLLPLPCSIECLFTRFAWTIFSPHVLGIFLTRCITSRSLLVYDPSTGTSTVESRNREQAQALFLASQSRSRSPKKRSAAGVAGSAEHDQLYDDMIGDASQADSGFLEERSPSRGRPRKRRWEAEEQEEQPRLVQKRAKPEIDEQYWM